MHASSPCHPAAFSRSWMGGRHDVSWSLVLMFCFARLSLRLLSVPYTLLHPRHTIFLLCVANRAVVKYLSLTPLPSHHCRKVPCILGWRDTINFICCYSFSYFIYVWKYLKLSSIIHPSTTDLHNPSTSQCLYCSSLHPSCLVLKLLSFISACLY